ncbi:hypothetical protein BST61_g4390 [Cercospora zeina]
MASYECSCGLSAQEKYGGREVVFPYAERTWPDRTLDEAPVLVSCDLRDGNQALARPMTFEQKTDMFLLLVAMGFKEIEVGFPCANAAEFAFVRHLVETPGLIPADVWIQVLTPCREDAIRTAVDSVRGAARAIIFTYLPSGDASRHTVLGVSEDEWVAQAQRGTRCIRALTKDDAGSATQWRFGFGLEDFGSARLEAAVRCADAVSEAWQPSADAWMYLGVASSVEVSLPNVFADRVERFSRTIARRECVRVAVHAHNDRGTAVASAELACLAGAQRIEGCLFGNGERAGNLDLVTFALNLLARGIDPTLDLRQLDTIRARCESLTAIAVHARAPYAGDMAFRAFSGGHQDAIRKGLHLRAASASAAGRSGVPAWPQWRIPYLPVDPADLGRSLMAAVMGITSQSGKAGVAMAVQLGLELDLPTELARAFSRRVKQRSLDRAQEVSIEETCAAFLDAFAVWEALRMASAPTLLPAFDEAHAGAVLVASHAVPNTSAVWTRFARTSAVPRDTALVAAYVQLAHESSRDDVVWGVGIGRDEEQARRSAVCSALLAPAMC